MWRSVGWSVGGGVVLISLRGRGGVGWSVGEGGVLVGLWGRKV